MPDCLMILRVGLVAEEARSEVLLTYSFVPDPLESRQARDGRATGGSDRSRVVSSMVQKKGLAVKRKAPNSIRICQKKIKDQESNIKME